ncbi:MAG: leucine-rich repeat domain-containing protein [Clostridia bacterium]|nr:leucine-rich repeat domain-containing protein [Clostridia bacterium]
MKKLILTMLTLVVMIFPVSHVYAENNIIDSGTCGERLTWDFDGESTLTISGKGEMTNYLVNGESPIYTSSPSPWSKYKNMIEYVIIEEGVTSIGWSAFSNHDKLKEITIPNGLIEIGPEAFAKCISIEKIMLPASLKTLGVAPFTGCSNLTTIEVSTENILYYSCDGILYKKITDDEASNNGNYLVCFPAGKQDASFKVPEGIKFVSAAFESCTNLKSVVLPENTSFTVSDRLFNGCTSLSNIIIPSGATGIGHYAFKNCYSLETISIPHSIKKIYDAFSNCYSLKKIQYDGSFVEWHNIYNSTDVDELLQCSEKDGPSGYVTDTIVWGLDVDNTLTIMGNGKIPDYSKWPSNAPWDNYKNSIKKIVIGDGISRIGSNSFNSFTQLINVEMSDSVQSIGDGAFMFCARLSSVATPNKLQIIENNAFLYCSALHSFDLPDGVVSIGNRAFEDCELETVIIPSTVVSIGGGAFSSNNKLTAFEVAPSNLYYLSEGGVLFNKSKNVLVMYPAGKNEKTYVIPNTVEIIKENAFSFCNKLEFVIFPQGLHIIEDGAFQYCNSLNEVYLPDGIMKIGIETFAGCSSLSKVVLPETVTLIDDRAFHSCISLVNLNLPSNLTHIGQASFISCSGLSKITIPDYVSFIGNSAFEGCTSLSDVILPNSITGLPESVFRDCPSLKRINLPTTLRNIGSEAFAHCTSLESISIPEKTNFIASGAFFNCQSIKSFCVDANNTVYTDLNGVLYSKDCSTLISYPNGNVQNNYYIPEGTTTIKESAFYKCKNLTKIILPPSIKMIENDVFDSCLYLDEIYFLGDAPTIDYRSLNISANIYYLRGTNGWVANDEVNPQIISWNGYRIYPCGNHCFFYDDGKKQIATCSFDDIEKSALLIVAGYLNNGQMNNVQLEKIPLKTYTTRIECQVWSPIWKVFVWENDSVKPIMPCNEYKGYQKKR